jgi:hypothetical protein
MAVLAPLLLLPGDADLEPPPIAFVRLSSDETGFHGARKEVSDDGFARVEATGEVHDGRGGVLKESGKGSDQERMGRANPDEVRGEDEVKGAGTANAEMLVQRSETAPESADGPLKLSDIVSPGVANDFDPGM